MKILANDGLHEAAIEVLRQEGHTVLLDFVEQSVLADYINAEGIETLFVRSATKVRKDLIDQCPNLKYIGRAGVGVDNIDVEYATSQGRHVFNTPKASSRSVAEMVMGMIFSWSRNIHVSDSILKDNVIGFKAAKNIASKGSTEVQEKTIGIIGFGNIGKHVAHLAEACGLYPLVYDPQVDCKWSTSFEILLAESDFITIHIGGKAEILAEAEFKQMKQSAVVINTSRGGCINEFDLISALDSGQIAGACLDVFVGEPNPSVELIKHSKVLASPHVGGSTEEAQRKIGMELVHTLKSLI